MKNNALICNFDQSNNLKRNLFIAILFEAYFISRTLEKHDTFSYKKVL